MTRIASRFAGRRAEGKTTFVSFVTAGDPDFETSQQILNALPAAGADVIELGMPFSDPMADGPAIQTSSQRALAGGQTMVKTLEMVRTFRAHDAKTPLVLMGYYNPIYVYPVAKFLADASKAGVDGLIVVDLPPEEDEELCLPATDAGINFIRLATPTTDHERLPAVLANSSGFLYYVSIAGITGTMAPDLSAVREHVARIKAHSDLPIAVGFGVKSPEQVRTLAQYADGVVVGSALVRAIENSLTNEGRATPGTVGAVTGLVRNLAQALPAEPVAAAT